MKKLITTITMNLILINSIFALSYHKSITIPQTIDDNSDWNFGNVISNDWGETDEDELILFLENRNNLRNKFDYRTY